VPVEHSAGFRIRDSKQGAPRIPHRLRLGGGAVHQPFLRYVGDLRHAAGEAHPFYKVRGSALNCKRPRPGRVRTEGAGELLLEEAGGPLPIDRKEQGRLVTVTGWQQCSNHSASDNLSSYLNGSRFENELSNRRLAGSIMQARKWLRASACSCAG
jgi:hypothetical protein